MQSMGNSQGKKEISKKFVGQKTAPKVLGRLALASLASEASEARITFAKPSSNAKQGPLGKFGILEITL